MRAQLALPTEQSILRGVTVGFFGSVFPASKLHISPGHQGKRGVPRQLIQGNSTEIAPYASIVGRSVGR
jgi:hypothetical protein